MLKKQIISFVKFVIPLFLCVLIAILLATLLLTAVYMIPEQKIINNVKLSANILKEEGTYPQVFQWCTSKLDNFTDAIMLTSAAYEGEKSEIVNAMEVTRGAVARTGSPTNSMFAHYVEGKPFDIVSAYPRYWHGYLVFLKPLLSIMDYSTIRVINLVFQLLLSLIIVCLLKKKNMKEYIIPYIISYVFLMPFVLAKSLQYSTCYYIMAVTCIVILLVQNKLENKALYIFLVAGIATAFFDFLTYPIATFGVPAVMYFCLQKNKGIKEPLFKLTKILFSWGLGYFGMWFGKWAIASIVTQENMFLDAAAAMEVRNGYAEASRESIILLEIIVAIGKNVVRFLNTPVTLFAVILVVMYAVMVHKKQKKEQTSLKTVVIFCLPFIVLASLPIVWYSFLLNHSTTHSIFTNKALVVTAFAVMCATIKCYKEDRGRFSVLTDDSQSD